MTHKEAILAAFKTVGVPHHEEKTETLLADQAADEPAERILDPRTMSRYAELHDLPDDLASRAHTCLTLNPCGPTMFFDEEGEFLAVSGAHAEQTPGYLPPQPPISVEV